MSERSVDMRRLLLAPPYRGLLVYQAVAREYLAGGNIDAIRRRWGISAFQLNWAVDQDGRDRAEVRQKAEASA